MAYKSAISDEVITAPAGSSHVVCEKQQLQGGREYYNVPPSYGSCKRTPQHDRNKDDSGGRTSHHDGRSQVSKNNDKIPSNTDAAQHVEKVETVPHNRSKQCNDTEHGGNQMCVNFMDSCNRPHDGRYGQCSADVGLHLCDVHHGGIHHDDEETDLKMPFNTT